MFDLRFYWSLLIRRLPVMLALFIICASFGAVSAIRAPATYTTAARLLVEDPQIVQEDSRDGSSGQALDVIEQQLMTRANLIDIANKLNVFSGAPDMSVDERVSRMRSSSSIRRSSGANQATLMEVSFTSPNPRTAAAVVNEFTTLILSANTKNRVGLAEERLAFFQQEVERLSADLDQQNAQILGFKRENANALPENLTYNQNRQSLLQERISRIESEIASLQTQRQDMVRLFEETGSIRQTGQPQTPEEQQLAQLRAELNGVLSIYAEDSPRVRALRNRIATTESLVQAQTGNDPAQETGNTLLNVNLSQIDTRLTALESELRQANSELDVVQAAVSATATNSIALGALERDQANIQARYNAAVADLSQARTAERIETSSRGQRISVLEAANVPNQPSGPNRKKIAAMGIGLGLALAGGFFVLMEILNNTIRRPGELSARFQITPLAVIPYIETREEGRKRRRVTLTAIAAVLILIPLGLAALHTQYMPLDVLTQKVVTRLGLG
ncbi:lipopolysaccharide biosynthesis [Paracoccus sp. 1_MG-2023]|uniref:GumC family protein n=1 Tax=unclassified Paracoccus (in: a-proteobacteria) TaxID=2688777 RepID=UPI001C0888C7|nr:MULTISPECIES: lipopolysaccharide biosynthesis [unclassified Paracoccus (in: a-proteobacteria)]MBU2958948.1 lipopolysaccharide biosynthesis [Paracoccus sp. C2R09]MDO6669962.1 lipopolysaccharide biosynthesis [Paracoccus sp. 1_MG-2023]